VQELQAAKQRSSMHRNQFDTRELIEQMVFPGRYRSSSRGCERIRNSSACYAMHMMLLASNSEAMADDNPPFWLIPSQLADVLILVFHGHVELLICRKEGARNMSNLAIAR
jgi:hypothetical protein